MLIYFVMIALPAMLALFAPRAKSPLYYAAVFTLYVAVIGFRYRVGMDWNNYDAIHRSLTGQDIGIVFQAAEYSSRFLFWFSANYLSGQVSSNVIGAVAFTAGLLFVANKTREPWLAVVVATPFLCVVTAMSATRQSLAIAVIFVLLGLWPRLGFIARLALIGVASLFHTSALALAPIVVGELRTGLLQKVLLVAVAAGGALFLATSSPTFMEQMSAYAELYTGAQAIVSQGAFMHVCLVALPALVYLLNARKLQSPFWSKPFLFWSASVALALLALLPFSSVGAGRLSMYFHYVPMIVVPLMIDQLGARNTKLSLRLAVIVWQVAFLWVWLTYSNSALAWTNYRSVLMSD